MMVSFRRFVAALLAVCILLFCAPVPSATADAGVGRTVTLHFQSNGEWQHHDQIGDYYTVDVIADADGDGDMFDLSAAQVYTHFDNSVVHVNNIIVAGKIQPVEIPIDPIDPSAGTNTISIGAALEPNEINGENGVNALGVAGFTFNQTSNYNFQVRKGQSICTIRFVRASENSKSQPSDISFINLIGYTTQITYTGAGNQPETYTLNIEDLYTIPPVSSDVTVTLKAGVGSDESDKTETVAKDSEYTLPGADTFTAKDGYSFKNWNVGGEAKNPGDKITVSTNIDVTAEWNVKNGNQGCYVATAVYGSYDCPEVWTLRRFRDEVLAKTWYGRLFIHLYYAVSPTAVKLFGNSQWFQNFFRDRLDKMVSELQADGFESTPYADRAW